MSHAIAAAEILKRYRDMTPGQGGRITMYPAVFWPPDHEATFDAMCRAALSPAEQVALMRLRLFRRMAHDATAMQSKVSLHPQECWESGDTQALYHLDIAIREEAGERPLFDLATAS